MTNSIDAIEKSTEKKWIKIAVEKQDGNTIVKFTDSGTGIPQKVINKVFENFFTTKDVGKGTGIGLALCKKMMISHGGDITVDKDALNTTFVLTFPNTAI